MKSKVLIVDDTLFMRQMLKSILEKEGYEICGEAQNGKEAIDKYQELKPDLTTIDIIMPLVDGIDGITAVKNILYIDPNAKIIIVSAMGQDALVVEAIQAGAKDFIVKPFRPLKVIEAVNKIISRALF